MKKQRNLSITLGLFVVVLFSFGIAYGTVTDGLVADYAYDKSSYVGCFNNSGGNKPLVG